MRTIFTLNLFLLYAGLCFSQTNQYHEFAKAYSTVRYFYPNPDLKEMDWNKYLTLSSAKIINNEFKLEDEILSLAPKSSFHTDSVSNFIKINKAEHKKYYYWQHFGGLVTQKRGFPEMLLASQLIGSIDRSRTMLRNQLFAAKTLHKRIKFEFHAKFPTNKKDSALVLLHSGYKDKKGKITDNYYRLWIYPSFDWKKYKLDTVFCENFPHKVFFTFVKIVRPTHNSLLIDDITIKDIETNKFLYRFSTESYDSEYNRFRFNYFYHSKNMALKSSDSYSGNVSLKLLGLDELSYYPQTELNKTIQIKINNSKWFQMPRFIKKDSVNNLDSIIKKCNLTEIDSSHVKAFYIADIIHMWTVLENSYPYSEIRETINSKELFNNCIEKIFNSKSYNKTEHFNNLTFLMSAYNDPHFSITSNQKNRKMSPVMIKYINGQYKISNVYSSKYLKYLGKNVKSINGVSIENLLSAFLYNYKSLNSINLLNTYLKYALSTYNNDSLILELTDNKKIRIKKGELVKYRSKPISSYEKSLADTSFSLLNGKAFYLHYKKYGRNHMNIKQAKDFVNDSLSKYEYIILDLRQRGYNYVSGSILETKLQSNGIKVKPDYMSTIQKPFSNNFKSINLNLLDATRHTKDKAIFNSKIIAITDENTKSISERKILPLFEANLITLVGKKTAGTAGNINKVYLPSGFKISYTTSRTKYQNGKDYQNNGMMPHFEIKETFNIHSKKDAFLEKAIEIMNFEQD